MRPPVGRRGAFPAPFRTGAPSVRPHLNAFMRVAAFLVLSPVVLLPIKLPAHDTLAIAPGSCIRSPHRRRHQ